MKYETACRVTERKEGRKWVETHTEQDAYKVIEELLTDLKAKYVYMAPYVKSVRRTTDYITETITVTYDNGYRSVYRIEI